MFVRLILAGGMNAGTVAEIKEGFYLIGRGTECQIRPESPSVSERHCLLQHQGKYFRAMPVDDQSPTLVNHKQLEAKQWVLLNHGDMLQVGRIAFLVAITAEDPALPATAPNRAAGTRDAAPKNPIAKQPRATTEAGDDFAERDTAEIDSGDVASQTEDPNTKPKSRWKGSGKTPKRRGGG